LGQLPPLFFIQITLGESWTLNEALFNIEGRTEWFGGGTVDPCLHSIAIDPKDDDHIFVAISCAGVMESRDRGQSWSYRNKGLRADFLPDPTVEWGHDPHLLVMDPFNSEILWQQNHCGIYRSADSAQNWADLKDSPGILSDFGFAITCSQKRPGLVYTVPAVSDEMRMAINGALCVQRTKDGGNSFEVLRKGLPQTNCYDIVFRHGLDTRAETVIFGTTTGNVYVSYNEGEEFEELFTNLAEIYSIQLV